MSTEHQGDDFHRIYGGCLQLPVMKAITGLVLGQPGSACDHGFLLQHELHCDFLSAFNVVVEHLRVEYDAVLGPRIELVGPSDVELGSGMIAFFDFDMGDEDEALCLPEQFEWTESALARAASSYKGECGWDFAPGKDGLWLAYVILTSSHGGRVEDPFYYHGNLVGFAILHDRDGDGQYESLSHMWTAQAARRKGVARQLLERARQDFSVRTIEAPAVWSTAGRALIKATWPEKALAPDHGNACPGHHPDDRPCNWEGDGDD